MVGIPGTEDYSLYLDDFAEAGGVPNPDQPPSYYAVSAQGGVEGLVSVFQNITERLVRSCEIQLERQAPAPGLVNVAVDCEPVRPMEADGSGWELDALVDAEPDHAVGADLRGDPGQRREAR